MTTDQTVRRGKRAVGVGDRRSRPRYAIQVVYASGDIAYLRHGPKVGEGAIVQFDRLTAAVNLGFIREGLDDGATASVVRYRKDMR